MIRIINNGKGICYYKNRDMNECDKKIDWVMESIIFWEWINKVFDSMI